MQLQQDTGSKQHILAEDSLGNELIPSLSNLYVAEYKDCIVLAVFSSLEKKIQSYKITLALANISEVEQWFHENFNKITHLTLTDSYEITPDLFATTKYTHQDVIDQILVSYETVENGKTMHYLSALIGYHLSKKLSNQIYIFCQDNKYTILLMNKETCLLANTFECKNEHEVLYFILNSLQISDILPSESTLLIDYSLLKDENLVHFISPHLFKTEFLNYTFEGINNEIPLLPEKLFSCFAASLCE